MTGDWRLWLEKSTAVDYLLRGRDGIPHRQDQLGVIVASIPFDRSSAIRVLDLGCGDAVLLRGVLEAFPQAHDAVAIDASPTMLRHASAALDERHGDVRLVVADLSSGDWRDKVHAQTPFDVVISGFAIHHLEDDRKRALFREVYEVLDEPGVFLNADHVRSRSRRGEELFEAWYVSHLVERARAAERDAEVIRRMFVERPGKAANRLASVADYEQWLRAAGFGEVDCYWKFFELAILAAYKCGEPVTERARSCASS